MKEKEEHFRTAVTMIKYGSNPTNTGNDTKITLLHAAAFAAWPKFVIYLLENTEAKEHVNSLDSNGNTPLHFIHAHIYDKSIVSCLSSHGAHKSVKNKEGWIAEEYSAIAKGIGKDVILLSGGYQGKSTFLSQAVDPLDRDIGEGRLFAKDMVKVAESILAQMAEVVLKTLEIIEEAQERKEEFGNDWEMYKLQGDEEKGDLGITDALESMERVKKQLKFFEEHIDGDKVTFRWDQSYIPGSGTTKKAMETLWPNEGFQYALENNYVKRFAATRYFFERMEEMSKPTYEPSDKDLSHIHHIHRKTTG